eukprot:TRINITY_DN7430_c0_g1_i1.p1 TRINITY_DN7430_c0_g1~~TRINITY_DN7430_c0_g1_i1.p1  ORF type:complete len:880 (+),score=163.70 TRINITY_DN7430_c0_g1_i1:58-2697(+)
MSSHASSGRLLGPPASSRGDYDEALATEEEGMDSPTAQGKGSVGHSLEGGTAHMYRINSTGAVSDLTSAPSLPSRSTRRADRSDGERDRSPTPDGSLTAARTGSAHGGPASTAKYRTTTAGAGQVAFALPVHGHEEFRFAEAGTVVGVLSSGTAITLRTHLCFPGTSFVSVLCRPAQPPLSGRSGQVPSPRAHPGPEELLIAASGVYPVKTAHMLPVGTYLIPSGFDDGYAVSGPASHPLAFAVVVSNSLDDGQVYARMLDTSSNAMAKCLEYQQLHTYMFVSPASGSPAYRHSDDDAEPVADAQESAPLLAEPGAAAGPTGIARAPMLFFLVLVTLLLGGSIAVIVHFLSAHESGGDVPQPSCNMSAAMQCAAVHAGFDQCEAAYIDPGDFIATQKCCVSPAAYACFQAYYCKVTCPPGVHYEPTACFNLASPKAWNENKLRDTIVTDLSDDVTHPVSLSISYNATGGTMLNPHVRVVFLHRDGQHQTAINAFFHRVANKKSQLWNALVLAGPAWLENGDPAASNYLLPSIIVEEAEAKPRPPKEGWIADEGAYVVVPCGGEGGGTVGVCYACEPDPGSVAATLRQNVSLAMFPDNTTFTLYGYMSVEQAGGYDASVSVRFYDDEEELLEVATPEKGANPRKHSAYYPARAPFFWSGPRPVGAVLAEVSLVAINDALAARPHSLRDSPAEPAAVAYFENIIFAPGPPACSKEPKCNPLRCVGAFNVTHSLCVESRVCLGDVPTPYNTPTHSPISHVNFVGGDVDVLRHTLGAVIGPGTMHLGAPTPLKINVYDADGKRVKYACSGVKDTCKNSLAPPDPNPANTTSPAPEFKFFFLLRQSFDVPPGVSSFTARDDPSTGFCMELGWWVTPVHHMTMAT